MKRTAGVVAMALLVAAGGADGQQTPPQFQSLVEVLAVDVTVVDGRGAPIEHLAPADFTVRVDGEARRVISAQWIPRLTAARTGGAAPADRPADSYVSNADAAGSGLVVIAVDEANIKFGAMRPLLPAITRFIDRLPAADRIAIVSFGLGKTAWSDFTPDRAVIKEKLAQMPGQVTASDPSFLHRVGIGAALAYLRGEPEALAATIRRACSGNVQAARSGIDCPADVRNEATRAGQQVLRNADLTIGGVRELLATLRTVDAPKTLLFISDGFGLDWNTGERRIVELGNLAAQARTTIYSLKIEESPTEFVDAVARDPSEIQRDQLERRRGIELLAYAARGALFTMSGTATGPFDRIESELSGYYLLGVEPASRDRDGSPRPIQITVSRGGAAVRSRRTTAFAAAAKPQTALARLEAALTNPLTLSALPMRGTAVALRGPDPTKIQLLLHADIGTEYTEPRVFSVAHVILDAKKQAVDGHVSELRLSPAGTRSPVQYARTATIDPGSYTVKIAAVDGDLAGSIEVRVHASLTRAGSAQVTELMVGGPVPPGDLLRPTLGGHVRHGVVHGYLEAYGRNAASLTTRFEVATSDGASAIVAADVPVRSAGEERVIFSQVLPAGDLPPGRYRLRATLRGDAIVTKSQSFEIAAPPPLPSGSSFFLTIGTRELARPFVLDDALQPATVQAFGADMAAAAAAPFDEGLAALRDRQYVPAAAAFERAVAAGGAGAPLAYLGVCFAAAGHDAEALAAWRKALGSGADVPEVHEWIVGALMRTKSYGEARAVARTAAERWPNDARFARPLALLDATSGNTRGAMQGLDRYLADRSEDRSTLFVALNWLFQAKRAGIAVHQPGEAMRLARLYAQRYATLDGPDQPLIDLWIDYLAR